MAQKPFCVQIIIHDAAILIHELQCHPAYQEVANGKEVYTDNHTQEYPSLPSPQPHSAEVVLIRRHMSSGEVPGVVHSGSLLVPSLTPHGVGWLGWNLQ